MATIQGSQRLLDISGNNISTAVSLEASGTLLDVNGAAGTSGQVLSSTGSAVDWVDASTVIGGPYVTIGTAQTITAAKTFTADVNVGAASTDGAGIHLIYSTTVPEIRIQAGENGASAFSIYNTATSPDAEQFFINNNLGSSHLGNARGALKLESSSGVVLTLSGNTSTFAGQVTANGAVIANGGITGLDIVGGISGNNYNITGVNQLTINDPGEGIVFSGTTNVQLFTIDDATDSILKITSATALDVNAKITNLSPGSANLDAVNYQQLTDAVAGVLVYQGTWNASTNTPALASGVGTPGYYYIVSTPGGTNLDGITDWNTGDWAIFSDQATDAWQKIDHTNVLNGAGTGNQVTKWSGSGTSYTLTDSIITDDGTNVGIGTISPQDKLHVEGRIRTNTSGVALGDTNAVIYRNSNDLELITYGGYDINLMPAGNVGIGTTSPETKLDVRGQLLVAGDTPVARIGSTLEVYRNGTTAELSIHQDDSTVSSSLFSQLRFRNGGNDTYFKVPQSGNGLIIDVEGKTNAFVIDISGNVGIGTTAPTAKLQIQGDTVGYTGSTAESLFRLARAGTGLVKDSIVELSLNRQDHSDNHPTTQLVFKLSGGGVDSSTASQDVMTLLSNDSGNFVGIGTTSPSYKLDVVDGGLKTTTLSTNRVAYYNGDGVNAYSSTGWNIGNYTGDLSLTNNADNKDIIFKASAGTAAPAEIMRIDGSSGNVGIGTTSPGAKLDIAKGSEGTYLIAGGDNASNGRALTFTSSTTGGSVGALHTISAISNSGAIALATAGSERMYIDNAGGIKFNAYGAGTLVTDASGNITASSGGGAGGPYLPLSAGASYPLTGTLHGTSTNFSGSGDYAGSMTLGTGASTAEANLQIGQGRTGNGHSYIDLIGDATYTDYGLRIIRGNSGANTVSQIIHRGTGDFGISTIEAANLVFTTGGAERMRINPSGNVGIGTTSPVALGGHSGMLTLYGSNATALVLKNALSEGHLRLNGPDFRFTNNVGDVRMQIETDTGNVGIGTTSPSYTLDVAGSINGTGLYVNTVDQNSSSRYSAPNNEVSFARTSTSDEWFKIWAGGGSPVTHRISIISSGDNTNMRDEYLVNTAGYGFYMHIQRLPGVRYNTSKLVAIAAVNPSDSGSTEIWIKLLGMASGSGTTVIASNTTIRTSAEILASVTTTAPTLTSNDTQLDITTDNRNNATLMTSRGATFGGNVGIGTIAPGTINSVTFSSVGLHTNFGTLGRTITEGSNWGEYILNDSGTTTNLRAKFIRSDNGTLSLGSYDDNGTSRPHISILNSGNVGIGTTNPIQKLHVVGSGYINAGSLFIDSGQRLNWGNSNQWIEGTSNTSLEFSGGGGSTQMILNSTGNVGIGTTSPLRKLDIIADLSTDAVRIKNTNINGGGLSVFAANGGGGTNRILTLGDSSENVKVAVIENGNVGIGTTTPSGNLEIGSGAGTGGTSVVFSGWEGVNHGSLKMYAYGNNTPTIQISASDSGTGSGTTYFNSGNVGIGTTSPDALLEISGNAGADPGPITNPTTFRITDAGNAATGAGDTTNDWGKIEFYSEDQSGSGPSVQAQIGTIYDNIYSTASNLAFKTRISPTAALTERLRIKTSGALSFYAYSGSNNTGTPTYLLGTDASGDVFKTNTIPGSAAGPYLPLAGGALSGTGRVLTVTSTNDQVVASIKCSSSGVPSTLGFQGDGSTSDYHVRIGANTTNFVAYTNNIERMRILSGGNVGIATTNPGYKLAVYGSTSGSEIVASFGNGNASNEYTAIGLSGFIASNGATKAGLALKRTGTYGTGELHFLNNNTLDNSDITLSDSKMTILGNGNVGIGTTSPLTELEVVGTARMDTGITESIHYIGTGIEHWGDGGTGMSFPANDVISFKTTSSDRLYINSTGNVGIGTTSPTSLLSVGNAATYNYPPTTVNIATTDTGAYLLKVTSDQFNVAGNWVGIGLGYSNQYMKMGIIAEAKDSSRRGKLHFAVKTTAGSSNAGISDAKMTIDDTGRVGIGTPSPAAKLEVRTDSGGSASNSYFRVTAAVDGAYGGTSHFEGAYNDYVNVNQPNIVGKIEMSSQVVTATDVGGTMKFFTKATGGTYVTAPLERMRIDSSGNLGIGVTNPGEKLTVAGSVYAISYWSQSDKNAYYMSYDSTRGMYLSSTGFVTLNAGGNEVIRMTSNAYVGIGTTTPTSKFHVVGASHLSGITGIGTAPTSSHSLTINSILGAIGAIKATGNVLVNVGSLGVNVTPSATAGRIDASNDIVAYSTSDKRLKENITPITNALEKVRSLTGVEFDWKEETESVHGYEGHDVGIIAQEVQAVLPEAVRTNESGYLSVRYEKMIALLVEANKELANRIEQLEKLIK